MAKRIRKSSPSSLQSLNNNDHDEFSLAVHLSRLANVHPGAFQRLPTRYTAPDHGDWFWASRSLPVGSTMLIASSRLGQKMESVHRWFDALRTLACEFSREERNRPILISHPALAADRFVRRAAQLWHIPFVSFREMPVVVNEAWIQEAREHQESAPPNEFHVYHQSGRASLSYDQWLAQTAAQMTVLSVRKNGKIDRCIRERLKQQRETRILIDNTVCKKSLSDQLLSLGAIGWWLFDCQDSEAHASESQHLAPLIDAQELNLDDYFLHWTRRRVGPWPDQSPEEHLDDLIFGTPSSDHRAVAALGRILASRRLLASNQLTRSQQPVVSWSAVPINELRKRRVFRSHLSRWDFELYGILIKRKVLQDLGARPVVYGTESDWNQMANADRPFFQLAGANWESEQEWRVMGDVQLDHVSADSAVVFVPSEQDARLIRSFSKWPVMIV